MNAVVLYFKCCCLLFFISLRRIKVFIDLVEYFYRAMVLFNNQTIHHGSIEKLSKKKAGSHLKEVFIGVNLAICYTFHFRESIYRTPFVFI